MQIEFVLMVFKSPLKWCDCDILSSVSEKHEIMSTLLHLEKVHISTLWQVVFWQFITK